MFPHYKHANLMISMLGCALLKNSISKVAIMAARPSAVCESEKIIN